MAKPFLNIISSASLAGQHPLIWRRAAMLVLLCLALAALASSEVLHAAFMDLLKAGEALIAQRPRLGALLFVLFAAISAMFAFVSVAVVLPVAVLMWGEPLSMLLIWVGWIIGGAGSYVIGRYVGRAVVKWLTAEAALHRFERLIGPNSPFSLVLVFQLALPSEFPGYVLGLIRYSPAKYLLALALAELPYSIAVVSVGAGLIERRASVVISVGVTLALFIVVAFHVLRRRLATQAPELSPPAA